MSYMKILILGARGSLGQQLVKIFKNDNQIIAWDKGEIDITDKKLILKKAKDVRPDIIINAAAYNATDKCEANDSEFELAKKINCEAVGYLAEAALETGATIIHYSTDYVFDGEKKRGYKEDDKPNPISRYGESKSAGEKAIISLSGKGLKWYLIRTSKLFGPKGESADSKENFFDLISRPLAESSVVEISDGKKKEFNMVHGEEISCFTYTPDLARATKELVESDKGYGIYHIINSGPASWYEGAKFLFELRGITDVKLNPIGSADYPRPAKRPKYSVLLNTKLPPLRDWKEALREYLDLRFKN